MGDAFGLGDGNTDLSGAPGLSDAKVADATRDHGHHTSDGPWPRNSTLFRVLLLIAAALIVVGWLLSAANSPA
jgi:hypothetical protein